MLEKQYERRYSNFVARLRQARIDAGYTQYEKTDGSKYVDISDAAVWSDLILHIRMKMDARQGLEEKIYFSAKSL